MGGGASSEGGGAGRAMRPARAASAQNGARGGARKRMLVSGNTNRAMTPDASSRGGKMTAGTSTPHGKRNAAKAQGTAHVTRTVKHRLKMQQEDDLRVLTRNADPLSLEVLEKIEASDRFPEDQPGEKLMLLQQCYPMLEKVPAEDFDQLAMAIYQKEGEIYQQQGEKESAKETYTRAITLAERRVARGDKDMYNVLKRYVMAMIGVARIWYEEERETKGFAFVDRKHPRVAAVDAHSDTKSDASSSLSSLESTFSSVGSVFSLNQAILESMAPRPPRRRTGPNIGTVKVKAPRQIPGSQLTTREDEFVLYSKMTRELVASPCELLLLRCCEVVEIGLHTQSELLIPPLIELAQLYEDLELYSRALLVVRRCLGILCNVYDYDHPWVIELRGLADYLDVLRQEQLRNAAATKIESVWRMYQAMKDLEKALGRPVHRHYWVPKKYRQTPDIDFLGDLADAIPSDENDDRALPTNEDNVIELPHTPPGAHRYPTEDEAYPNGRGPGDEDDGPFPAPVVYDPVRSVGEVATFTTTVPNAKVIGTTQDTQTDTHVQPTDKGDVLTVRTTTITKTVTEKLTGSDEDDAEEDPTAAREEPCEVPVPHCPRCDRALSVPHCRRCERPLPPPPLQEDMDELMAGGVPRCPYCRVHRPGVCRHCPHCEAMLPSSRRWPVSGAEPDASAEPHEVCERCHEHVPLDICRGCAREQPPPPYAGEEAYPLDPDGVPRCPFCRERQPAMRCADCDRTPDPEPLAAEKKGEAPCEEPEEVPVPHCPRCDRELEEPLCPRCERMIPPPPPPGEAPQETLSRCPFCRVHQPAQRCPNCYRTLPLVRPEAAPEDAAEAAHNLHVCPYCADELAPEACPACDREQPPAPYAGEEDYASDPSKPPRCPYCRERQPAMRCADCDRTPDPEPLAAEEKGEASREEPEEVPVPHCPRCDVEPDPLPQATTQTHVEPLTATEDKHADVAVGQATEDEQMVSSVGAEEEDVVCPKCGVRELEFPPDCPYCRSALPPEIVPTEPNTAENPTDEPAPLCPLCQKVLPLACPHCDAPLPATAGATPVQRQLPSSSLPETASRAAQTSPPPPSRVTPVAAQVPAQDVATMTLPEPKPQPRRDAQTATDPEPVEEQTRAVPPPPAPVHAARVPSPESEREEEDEYKVDDDDVSPPASEVDDGSSAYTVVSSHSSVRYEQYPGGAAPVPPPVYTGMYPGMGPGNHYYYVYYPVGGAMPVMMGAPGMVPAPPPAPQQPPPPPAGHSRHHRYRRSSRSTRRGSKSVGSVGGPNVSGSTVLSDMRFPCPSCRRTLPPLRCPECARRQPEPTEDFLYDPENPPHCRHCGVEQPIAHCPYCFIELARSRGPSGAATTTRRASASANKTSTAAAATSSGAGTQIKKPVPPSQPRRGSAGTATKPDGYRAADVPAPLHTRHSPQQALSSVEHVHTHTNAEGTLTATAAGVSVAPNGHAGEAPPLTQYTVKKDANGNTVHQETTDTPGGFRIVREYTIERTRIDRTTVSDDDDDGDRGEEEDAEDAEEEEDEGDITDLEEDEEVREMLAELRARDEQEPVLTPSPHRGGAGASASLLPSISAPMSSSASRGGFHNYNGSSFSNIGVNPYDPGLDEAITTTTRDVQRIPNGKRTVVRSITRRRSQLEQPSTLIDVNQPGSSLLYGFPDVTVSGGTGVSLPTLSHRSSYSGSVQRPPVPTAAHTHADHDNVMARDEL